MIDQQIINDLRHYARLYETASFLESDPSQFMHRVSGCRNQEVMAFIASCLSYGSRRQFLPKIEYILTLSGGQPYDWVRSGAFSEVFSESNNASFYRLYSYRKFGYALQALQQLLADYHSLGEFIALTACDGLSAVKSLCSYFSRFGVDPVVPKSADSCCKRLCMLLRWMVRDGSAVDLGLWANLIDKRTLIIPLDTHVLQQADRLGLLSNRAATMNNAIRLTQRLAEIFPDDPLKADFALFGFGVNHK